jgi:SAM-dependent methyltransferase
MNKLTTTESYDRVAEEYASRIYGELAGKPFDRELLDRFAEEIRPIGPCCDLGCGPGHVGRYLHDRGVEVVGCDVSEGMLAVARRLNPEMSFERADMLSLDFVSERWSAVAAFYSLIHVPRPEMARVLRDVRKSLKPGGQLLVAFHVGTGQIHRDDLWDIPVDLDFLFFQSVEMGAYLREAGFIVEETHDRDPYPDVEHPSRRGYILARK